MTTPKNSVPPRKRRHAVDAQEQFGLFADVLEERVTPPVPAPDAPPVSDSPRVTPEPGVKDTPASLRPGLPVASGAGFFVAVSGIAAQCAIKPSLLDAFALEHLLEDLLTIVAEVRELCEQTNARCVESTAPQRSALSETVARAPPDSPLHQSTEALVGPPARGDSGSALSDGGVEGETKPVVAADSGLVPTPAGGAAGASSSHGEDNQSEETNGKAKRDGEGGAPGVNGTFGHGSGIIGAGPYPPGGGGTGAQGETVGAK
jgi:hypothetical protein